MNPVPALLFLIAAVSDPVLLAAIAAVSAAVTSAIALFKTSSTHKIVNSRMTELLSLAKKSSKAEGVKEGAQLRRSTAEPDEPDEPALTRSQLIEILNARDAKK